jgi:hypothetical protein
VGGDAASFMRPGPLFARPEARLSFTRFNIVRAHRCRGGRAILNKRACLSKALKNKEVPNPSAKRTVYPGVIFAMSHEVSFGLSNHGYFCTETDNRFTCEADMA